VREAELFAPFSAEVKNEWSYTSAPPLCLRGVHTDKFVFFTLVS